MADAFTPERIAQLREILAKATPGLWYVPPHNESAVYGGSALVAITYPCSKGVDGTDDGDCTEESNANARLITVVNILPSALDEIERLYQAIAIKGGTEHAPTEDAYSLACAAIEKHRARSETAETELSRITAERDEAVEIMTAFATAECDYMRINNLGDGEKQYNVRRARSFLSRMEGLK